MKDYAKQEFLKENSGHKRDYLAEALNASLAVGAFVLTAAVFVFTVRGLGL